MNKIVVLDVALVGFWVAVCLFELFFTQDMLLIIVAFACVLGFSALLGRDIKKQKAQ